MTEEDKGREARSDKMWMAERRFRISAPGTDLDGYVTPIRFIVIAATKKGAALKAPEISEEALKALTENQSTEKRGEWAGEPVILYRT